MYTGFNSSKSSLSLHWIGLSENSSARYAHDARNRNNGRASDRLALTTHCLVRDQSWPMRAFVRSTSLESFNDESRGTGVEGQTRLSLWKAWGRRRVDQCDSAPLRGGKRTAFSTTPKPRVDHATLTYVSVYTAPG